MSLASKVQQAISPSSTICPFTLSAHQIIAACCEDLGRIEEAHFAELYEAKEGDACPCCDGTLTYTKGIEVGHIFKLGTVYSAPLKAPSTWSAPR